METAHIYVYGVIDYWQDANASDWGYVNLKDIKNQYEAQKEAKNITVHIHSEGGVVTEGFAIHDYLRSLGKPVKTVIEGTCASIATVIALAGDERVMTSNANFFIHNPWGVTSGESADMKKYADELERLEGEISEFYAQKTNISKDEALEFMKNETTFSAEQALEKGFITRIETVMRAVALINNKKMAEETVTKKEFSGMLDAFATRIASLIKGTKEAPKMLLIQDVNGTEIDFPNVEEGQTPAVEDTATIDGSPAEGEYTLEDGTKYTFEGGALTAITEPEEETEEEDEEMAQLKEENEQLKSENETILASLKQMQKDFNELKNVAGNFALDKTKTRAKDEKEGGETKRKL